MELVMEKRMWSSPLVRKIGVKRVRPQEESQYQLDPVNKRSIIRC